ncbi:MAG: enoyl-CoA hydratase-related protein, partial [Pseudomonadota bacterium]|nr:enoyl-CoA hydratase-related protein [Pseudomonadota bacterium]
MTYETILTETRGRVLLVTFNRPEALNALSLKVADELVQAMSAADRDSGIGCIVLTGSEKAFAAGADIKEMQDLSFQDLQEGDLFSVWE